MRFDLTDPDLAYLLRWVQHGVVSRRQIEERGGRESERASSSQDRALSWKPRRRDLAELATSNDQTARVTYGLVFREQCQTACWIGLVLNRLGWTGEVQRCPRCPDRPVPL